MRVLGGDVGRVEPSSFCSSSAQLLCRAVARLKPLEEEPATVCAAWEVALTLLDAECEPVCVLSLFQFLLSKHGDTLPNERFRDYVQRANVE